MTDALLTTCRRTGHDVGDHAAVVAAVGALGDEEVKTALGSVGGTTGIVKPR